MEQPFEHTSVLLEEAVALLALRDDGVYCDATIGGGGHAERILEASQPKGRLIGIDRDENAVATARRRLARFGDRVSIYQGRFSQLEEILARAGVHSIDGLLLDLGVSSHQLDVAARGFSFMKAGPLDMRMDSSSGETAGEMLARLSEDELADILYQFGEERMSRKIARSIKQMERAGTLDTTHDLAIAVRRVMGNRVRPGQSDPATRTFQAIRIAVNDEFGELDKILSLLPGPLAVDGSVVVITFHSLEDRMVKQRFAQMVNPCVCPPGMPVCPCPLPEAAFHTRRSVRVSGTEREQNRRSRSARVRSIRRIR